MSILDKQLGLKKDELRLLQESLVQAKADLQEALSLGETEVAEKCSHIRVGPPRKSPGSSDSAVDHSGGVFIDSPQVQTQLPDIFPALSVWCVCSRCVCHTQLPVSRGFPRPLSSVLCPTRDSAGIPSLCHRTDATSFSQPSLLPPPRSCAQLTPPLCGVVVRGVLPGAARCVSLAVPYLQGLLSPFGQKPARCQPLPPSSVLAHTPRREYWDSSPLLPRSTFV